jgi:ABC-2 type transport system permease protein
MSEFVLERSVPAATSGAAGVARTRVMIARCLRLGWRNTDALITSLVLPIMLMLMFVYLFGGAIRTGTAYHTYVVPGVMVLCAGYGSALTAVRVTEDMAGGVIDRLRSMNVGGGALLTGHVVASAVRNAVSSVLVLGVALAIGFRPHAGLGGWLGAAGLLMLFIVAISALSAVVGMLVRSAEAANACTFAVLFLPYPSSAFVPIASMPSWIRGFARNQPVTPVIESIRNLLLARPAGHAVGLALAWCAAILVVSVVASLTLYQRRASRA